MIAAVVFYALATLTLTGAAGVALGRNILYSAFSLLASLLGVAGLYLLAGADFVGIAQLLIYVGGILVLLLFAVLLTNRIGAIKVSNASVALPVGGAGAAALGVLRARIAVRTRWPEVEAAPTPSTARLGEAFLREYLLPFELASVLLLVSLVGAMVIGRRAARADAIAGLPPQGPGLP
jgi:NADH-quinone oxidoreductase subunit J